MHQRGAVVALLITIAEPAAVHAAGSCRSGVLGSSVVRRSCGLWKEWSDKWFKNSITPFTAAFRLCVDGMFELSFGGAGGRTDGAEVPRIPGGNPRETHQPAHGTD